MLTAVESCTVVKPSVQAAATTPVPPKCTAPIPPTKWYDFKGWINYAIAWVQYQRCLRG